MRRNLHKAIAKVLFTRSGECPICHRLFFAFHPYKEHVKVGGKDYRYVCHHCHREHLASQERSDAPGAVNYIEIGNKFGKWPALAIAAAALVSLLFAVMQITRWRH